MEALSGLTAALKAYGVDVSGSNRQPWTGQKCRLTCGNGGHGFVEVAFTRLAAGLRVRDLGDALRGDTEQRAGVPHGQLQGQGADGSDKSLDNFAEAEAYESERADATSRWPLSGGSGRAGTSRPQCAFCRVAVM